MACLSVQPLAFNTTEKAIGLGYPPLGFNGYKFILM